MNFQFSDHAVRRLCGRMSNVIGYGEAQSKIASTATRNTYRDGEDFDIVLKTLPQSVKVQDEEAYDGYVLGSKVIARCVATRDGYIIKTITLNR